jgi:hypothetical protein
MKRINLALLLLLMSTAFVFSQAVIHPGKGSSERAAILDGLRPTVETKLKQKIVFLINEINQQGNWVFVDGRLRTPDGEVPNWKNTPYAEAAKYGAQSDGLSALMRRSGSRWSIITYAIGCTDVCYVDWWRRFKAPKAIFPYTE